MADALAEAGSAAQTTKLVVDQLSRGRLTGPVADTALLDQLRVLDDADLALTTLVPPDPASSGQRATGLAAVGDLTDVVVTAREWVAARSGGHGPASGARVTRLGSSVEKEEQVRLGAGGHGGAGDVRWCCAGPGYRRLRRGARACSGRVTPTVGRPRSARRSGLREARASGGRGCRVSSPTDPGRGVAPAARGRAPRLVGVCPSRPGAPRRASSCEGTP